MATKITMKEWVEMHPLKHWSSTNYSYLKIANELLGIIRLSPLGHDLNEAEQVMMALQLTAYFEDVVSDLGLWKAFVRKHKELYGKYLPFYELGKEEYYADEVHEVDIRYLIWSHMMEIKVGTFINPENRGIVDLAYKVFLYLDKEFDRTPMNEELKAFLYNPERLNDFFAFKHLLMWMCKEAYLLWSCITDEYMGEWYDQIEEWVGDNMDEEQIIYFANSLSAMMAKVGPLALLPQEWLALMCREEGMEDVADNIARIKSLPIQIYAVEKYDSTSVWLKAPDGENYELKRKDFDTLPDTTLKSCEHFISSLICYKGQWCVNGMNSWGNMEEAFAEACRKAEEKKVQAEHNLFAEMMAKNDNSPLFYFKDINEMRNFFSQNMQVYPQFGQDKDDWKEIAVFVESGSDLAIAPGVATCIKDERNPYYDFKRADDESLNLIVDVEVMTPKMLHYLLEHQLLSDARINSERGPERGRQLVQENIDFIARYMRREKY